jgi:serine/threonine protein kinase
LAKGYDLEGQSDKAIDKMEEVLTIVEDLAGTEDLSSRLAELLEQRGDEERAIEVLETLQFFCASYPNLETRLETLRKQVSVERSIAAQATDPQKGTMVMGSSPAMVQSGSRYDIVEQSGRGGMGVVFKARDRRLGRHVAIKQLPEDLREHETAVQLFLSEARSVALLNHPNIVTLYDADQEGEKYFITMELLEGKPLSRILRKHGRFSPRDCARLGLQVAAGLHYAHGKRIVHRDIKMGNLFYTREKVVKIMDFGIAKVMEEVRKGTTVMGGTPNYMSPEQTLGKSVDTRTDIYAFGVTLYEMLTGKLPFIDGDVAYHHCHTPPPNPCELVPEIPQGLGELILQMMAKDPEERIATAAQVAAQLKRFAS